MNQGDSSLANEPDPAIAENIIYRLIMARDPTAFTRWEVTHFRAGGVSGGLTFGVKSRRYDGASITIIPPHYGNNEKSDKYQVNYSDKQDCIEITWVSEGELIPTINWMVKTYEAPVKDEDTESERLWHEILALITTQDPGFFRRWGIWQVRNERSSDFANNSGPEDWTGTRWDDSGVLAFQMPHPESSYLWVHVDGRYLCNQWFTILIYLGDAELERLDGVEPPELVAVLESLIKKYQNITEEELEAPF